MWFTSRIGSKTVGHPIRPIRSVPRLEVLEDRTLPSTLTVLNNLDKGAGSLRDTITNAKSGDTIVFTPSLDGQTITLTSDQLTINKSLNIEGPGAALLAISGNNTNRVFAIDEGLTVTIAGLTITHGFSNGVEAGGILDAGSSLTLANDVLSFNEDFSNTSPRGGGAIALRNGAALAVTGSSFLGNQAIGPKDSSYITGGAIVIDSKSAARVTSCTFSDNAVVGSNGGNLQPGYTILGTCSGGAINSNGNLIISNSTFAGNQAIGGSGDSGGKGSGAPTDIGVAAGGAIWSGGRMIVTGSTFVGNEAVGGSNNTAAATGASKVGAGESGALENGPSGVATVMHCTFANNEALGGNDNTGGNNAIQLGAGIGGGMRNAGTLTLDSCNFTDNLAVGGASNTGGAFAGAGTGGGLANQAAVVTAGAGGAGAATISNSIFTGNEAIGGAGGPGGNGGDGLGGGIANILGSTLTVSSCTLTGNGATGGAGGVGGNGLGGGVYNDGLSVLPANAGTPATLTITGTTITDNQATGGATGTGGSVGQGIGGGAYFAAGGDVCLDLFTEANIDGNSASTSNNDVFGSFMIC